MKSQDIRVGKTNTIEIEILLVGNVTPIHVMVEQHVPQQCG